jgi:hypothetical protein
VTVTDTTRQAPTDPRHIGAALTHGKHAVNALAGRPTQVGRDLDALGARVSTLGEAIADMADALGSQDVFGDGGTTLNCIEADRIARVMALAGHLDAAVHFLAGHAEGDDEGDDHHLFLNGMTINSAAAIDYVAKLAH